MTQVFKLPNATPMFTHDCARCTFVGSQITVLDGGAAPVVEDVYRSCDTGAAAVLRRDGSEGDEYAWLPLDVAEQLTDQSLPWGHAAQLVKEAA